MAKQKSRKSRMSSGKIKAIHKAQYEKKMKKFAAKREAGTAYQWTPNPYKKGSDAWHEEEAIRREKRWSNSRTDVAIFTSIMAKLDNKLAKEQMANKERKANAPKHPKKETN